MKGALYGKLRNTDCCGLMEFHTLSSRASTYNYDVYQFSATPGLGYFATTVSTQKREMKLLKANGFKKVGKWRNKNSKNVVTMWLWTGKPRKKKVNGKSRK